MGIAHPNLASGSSDVPCSKSPQTHIAELADDYLRTLIGLLCEAELARRGLPVSVVTWGGNQRAADGGLDVRVSLPAGSAVADFMPRPNTGFQVKCQDMPRAAILEEMRPSGVLRPVIRELADASGAYVIASSQGSTADSALRNRCAAMAEAVAGLPNAEALTLDFHDRTRWLRGSGQPQPITSPRPSGAADCCQCPFRSHLSRWPAQGEREGGLSREMGRLARRMRRAMLCGDAAWL